MIVGMTFLALAVVLLTLGLASIGTENEQLEIIGWGLVLIAVLVGVGGGVRVDRADPAPAAEVKK